MVSYVNISGAEVVDTGEYKCIADNGLAQISHRAQISVSGPLQVKRGANSNLTVLASSTLRLRCPVAGYPISEIQWHHNGRRLPANHRQRIFDNGTLEVEHMERGQDDQGLYTCIASSSGQPNPNAIGPASSSSSSNSNGPDSPGTPTSSPTSNTNNNKQQQSTQAQGSVFVTIKARPSIAPFVISNSLREGERATIGCTVSSGDLPIEISWFRNGRPIWLLTDEQQQQQQQDNKINQLSSSSKSLALGLSNNNNNEQRQVPNAGNPNVASLYANANEQLSLAGGQLSNSLGDSIQAAPLSGVRVIGVSEYSSTLLFESLSVSHSGNYSCVARNDAGTASHQSQMIVQGKSPSSAKLNSYPNLNQSTARSLRILRSSELGSGNSEIDIIPASELATRINDDNLRTHSVWLLFFFEHLLRCLYPVSLRLFVFVCLFVCSFVSFSQLGFAWILRAAATGAYVSSWLANHYLARTRSQTSISQCSLIDSKSEPSAAMG